MPTGRHGKGGVRGDLSFEMGRQGLPLHFLRGLPVPACGRQVPTGRKPAATRSCILTLIH
ncbi:MAG: hypothetical protein A2149_06185 [Candidatus Schekmanbacteria bacterium RBG_16_38_11]|uniref:Uncharacterized protein n=1 Tax=Candidatus Schekmanbacteria bacterium RBG_16_38_11 TaxID=1817880 RepID=A0A1F7RQQ7_9BACT|nr:MAG: hypothetical protein A2149_06185 [Candidatus Schekmanbacteria bacterium RBG_16_38_11]